MANDYRVTLTKKMFKSALLEMLKNRRIGNITVKELCDKANVNRGTFYSHYEDIFALLKEIETELETSLKETLNDDLLINKKFFVKLIEFFEENLDMCVIVLVANGHNGFLENLLEFGRTRFIEEYKTHFPSLNEKKLILCYTFISAGCVDLIRGYVAREIDLTKEEFAEVLENITAFSSAYVLNDDKVFGGHK